MILNLVMFVCMAPVPVILFLVMRNEAKPKKNIILGVTLPKDAREDPRVLAVTRRYNRRQSILFILVMALLAPALFLRSQTYVIPWYLVWTLAAIFLPNVPYVAANKQLKSLKHSCGWYSDAAGMTLVDTRLALMPGKPLAAWAFVPAVLLSIVPVVHTVVALRGRDEFWPMLIVYATFAAMAAGSYFLYKAVFHQRAEVVDGNTTVNAALTQVRRYNWSKSWVVIVWLTSLLDLVIWVAGGNTGAVVIAALAYSALLLGLVMQAEFKIRKVQQKLTAGSGTSDYSDDDDHWYMGMFYYNPNDSHTMVNRRTGMGTTLNMAKTPAKILMGFVALVLLSIPATGLFIIREGKTPVRLELSGESTAAVHTRTVFTIDFSDVHTAYLISVLPDGIRTNGTAMDNVLKGSFRLEGIGDCRLCLDPRTPPFIVAVTEDETYIIGSADAEETKLIFDTVQSLETVQKTGG